jgi:hypothetical protein
VEAAYAVPLPFQLKTNLAASIFAIVSNVEK